MPTERRRAGLLTGANRPLTISLMAAIALVSYNNLSVTAALPDIGDDLGSVSLLPWIITAELLAAAVAVLAIGPSVDGQGVRRVFRVAMLVFVGCSVLCAAAPSMLVLIVFRIGQGMASGGVIGSAISSIGLAYEPSLRPRVYAMTSAVWGVMGVGGPAIAAGLISLFGWRSIFTVTVPIGLIATAIGWNRLPDRREGTTAAAFDRLGLVQVTVITVGLLMAASTPSLWAVAWFAVAALFALAYVRHHGRVDAPVVRLDHLTGRRWRYLHITATLAVAGGTGASAYLPLYLRGARGASASQAAFSVLFLVIGWSCAAFAASKLQERIHAAHVVLLGTVLLISATSLATIVTALELHVAFLLVLFFFVGTGIGSITTSGLALLQGRARPEEMGRVSSAHQFVRSLGFAYGAAIGGLVLLFVVDLRIGDVEAIRDLLGGDDVTLDVAAVDALQTGYVWSLGVTAAFTAISVASAVKLVRSIGLFEDASASPDEDREPVVS